MKNNNVKLPKRFDGQRRMRPWANSHFGGMEAVKAHPLAICRFRPDEGGTVGTQLNVTLAPVSGYMRSRAYVDVKQVWVPYQAIEALWLDEQEDAGVTEMARRRLLAGQGIGLEDENEISKAANVHPRTIGGVNKVSATVRLAYLAAVNHLRKVAYFNATLLPKTETAIAPALLSANILKRFDGVLEPENLIDGAINLTGELPVAGIGRVAAAAPAVTNKTLVETATPAGRNFPRTQRTADGFDQFIEYDSAGVPLVRVDLEGAGEISLRDLMQAKLLDGLVRNFAGMIKDDPVHGEEAVQRALYGISVDFDDNCHVLFDHTYDLAPVHTRPTDGASINDISANFQLDDNFATIVPRSELGGQLVTLVSVKPLEVLLKQPDPAQTEAWTLVNKVHDELALDEVLLTRQDLESGVAAIDQDTEAFWVGHNALKHRYDTQGANAQQILGVEMKSSMWLYEIPTSVTPGNVSYPAAGIDMYPFYNWNGAAAEYTVRQVAAISTPLALGPNPVERIQLFADDPTLVEAQ